MKSMSNLNHKNITRRSFLYGGAAVLAASGIGLTSCGLDANAADNDAKIKAVVAYTSTQYDPVGQTTDLMIAANWHVYEGLYELDYHSYEAYPALAQDYPERIDDLTYKINLRSGAKFSDGSTVTVDDVISSFGANMSSSAYKTYFDFIKSCKRGDSSDEIILNLNYDFDSLLCKRLAIIKICKLPESGSTSASKLKVGSGPWAFKDVNGEDGGHITFVPNSYYNGKNSQAKDKMLWTIKLDSSERAKAICDKAVYVAENVAAKDVDDIKDKYASVVYDQGFAMSLFVFNTLNEKFIDKRARQALFYAINTQKLINEQLAGQGSQSTCLMPRGCKNYHKASTVFEYNPDKARQLLKETGNENLEFDLLVNTTWVKDLAPQIKEDLEAVGIKCNLSFERIRWDKLGEQDDVLPFDVILTGGDPSPFGDDADIALSIWYGDNAWTHGRSCWAKNPNTKFNEIQDLLQKARAAQGEEQQNIWNQCFDIIADQVPIYPILHKDIATAYYPNKFNNYKPIQSTGLNFINVTSI